MKRMFKKCMTILLLCQISCDAVPIFAVFIFLKHNISEK